MYRVRVDLFLPLSNPLIRGTVAVAVAGGSMTREPLVIVDQVATTKKCKLVLSPSRSNLGLVRSYWWKVRQSFEIYNLGMVSGPVF